MASHTRFQYIVCDGANDEGDDCAGVACVLDTTTMNSYCRVCATAESVRLRLHEPDAPSSLPDEVMESRARAIVKESMFGHSLLDECPGCEANRDDGDGVKDQIKEAVNTIGLGLNEYQERAATTAVYPQPVEFEYLTLKLQAEAGEVGQARAKWLRGDYTAEEAREKTKKELGDVLWYVAKLAGAHGFTLEEVARANLDKVLGRKERGTLKGSGDER